MGQTNYDGLAELGWRGTRTINGKNGYYDWERLSDVEKQRLNVQWAKLPRNSKLYLRNAIVAAIDAYSATVLV
jgi:hypothetical protein